MSYEEKRTEFLATIHPGDLVSWTTFDGSSVMEVSEVTNDEIVVRFENGNESRWPRSGRVHREHYGGFYETLGPPSPVAVESFLRNRHRHSIEISLKGMDSTLLRQVDAFCAGLQNTPSKGDNEVDGSMCLLCAKWFKTGSIHSCQGSSRINDPLPERKTMTRSNHIAEEDKIIFIDPLGEFHPAQVTKIWGDPDQNPTINLRCTDTGEEFPSTQHRSSTDAPGRYWMQW
jgi:hypothetical protein